MILAIPFAPGISIRKDVIDSLGRQDMLFEYHFKGCGEPYETVKNDRQKLLDNICLSRNACLDTMKAIMYRPNETCAVMNDTDCEHLFNDNISKAVEFLNENIEFAVVALSEYAEKDIEPTHVKCGVWVFHKRFFTSPLRFTHTDRCECECMCNSIRQAGWRIGYLDGVSRIKNH
jgi:hypothetical protein